MLDGKNRLVDVDFFKNIIEIIGEKRRKGKEK